MPSANVTVTAVAGPGQTLTAGVFTGCTGVNFNLASNTFTILASDGSIKTFDWQSIATVTFTVSGHNGTVAIS